MTAPDHTIQPARKLLARTGASIHGVAVGLAQGAGDIVLLHTDESEALTHPYLARAWAKRGSDLRVPAPGQSRKVAMLGARDAVTGALMVVTSKTKRSDDFIGLLEEIGRVFGRTRGRRENRS